MDVYFDGLYYNFIKHEKISTINTYHKFLNWISGEFDLYQIDNLENFKVYYPNGWFTIKMQTKNNDNFVAEIHLKCKSKKNGLKTFQKIESVYFHLTGVLIKQEVIKV